MVDNCAIWVGSDNLYPFWLSEYSLLVENRRSRESSSATTRISYGATPRATGRSPGGPARDALVPN